MLNIRPIEEKDLAIVAEYEREISIMSFGAEAILELEFHQRKLRKGMLKEGEGMLVLEIEGKIAGWLWMTPKVNFLTKEKYMNFKSFYISEAYRGTDCVMTLMDRGMRYSRQQGVSRIVGYVHVSNLSMRVLYKNYGFEPTHLTMEYNVCDEQA